MQTLFWIVHRKDSPTEKKMETMFNNKLTSRVSCTPALIPNHSTVLLANSRSVINEIRFAIM